MQAGAWTPATDAQSQDNWGILVGQAVNMQNIIQAGNSLSAPPIWGAAELIATENDTVKSYVRDYAHHNYPGGSVDSLMSHAHVSSNMGVYKDDIAAANGVGKDYVFGETNSGGYEDTSKVSEILTISQWLAVGGRQYVPLSVPHFGL